MILTNYIQQKTVTLRVCNYRLIVPLTPHLQEQTAEDKWVTKFMTLNSYSFSEGKYYFHPARNNFLYRQDKLSAEFSLPYDFTYKRGNASDMLALSNCKH